MSRSFTPPDTLSKEEIRTIADVRRDIWTNSFKGLGYGSLTGITGHTLLSVGANRGLVKMKLNRNTALLSFLLGGALGSFLAASVTGKNQVHNLHPIFEVGATKPEDRMTSYQKSLQRAQERDMELRNIERDRLVRQQSKKNAPLDEAEQRRRNRQIRRMTLKDRLEGSSTTKATMQSGTDKDLEETKQQRMRNRMLRRMSLKDTLEKKHGLNDSHGGVWINDSGKNDKHM